MTRVPSTRFILSLCLRRTVMLGLAIIISLQLDLTVVAAWQSGNSNSQEFIESSSPLPGGGVVSSVYYPGQTAPAATAPATTGQGNSVLVRDVGDNAGQTRVAQAQPAYVYPQANYANPQATYQNPPVGYSNPPTLPYYVQPNMVAVPAAQQVPSLGVPVPWNRAFRPDCAGCGTNQQYAGAPVYAPANLTGIQPPAATLPPTLPNTGSYPGYQAAPPVMAPAPRPTYQPLVQLQNMQPNAYPGQGIIGSPKMYVDGQPVRNLMRYLIIP